VTPQSAQALLKSLEDGGWITRTKDRVNNRILTASLTKDGEKLLLTVEKVAKVIEAKLWRGVEEDSIVALNGVLEECLANLEPEADI
jgi:DNA-binding MarR family transcriptional regulator